MVLTVGENVKPTFKKEEEDKIYTANYYYANNHDIDYPR